MPAQDALCAALINRGDGAIAEKRPAAALTHYQRGRRPL